MIEMGKATPPVRCSLCNARQGIVTAKFYQMYPQNDAGPVLLDWWECRTCGGWFVHPVPTPEIIARYWGTVIYNDPSQEAKIGMLKNSVYRRILGGLVQWTEPGPLLDYGCNFGQFLLMARDAGFTPIGFDPYETAAEIARKKGVEVYCSWSLEDAGFLERQFVVITAIDSFYYSWDPYATLKTFFRLLRPGGVLAMRLTNKRFILGLIRFLLRASPRRDQRIAKLLQAQFHSIGLRSLSWILRDIGFDRIQIQPRAATAPWSASGWGTRITYLLADMAYLLSVTTFNLYPGVLLFARKAVS